MREEKIRTFEARRDRKRAVQLDTMERRRDVSLSKALELQHPYEARRAAGQRRREVRKSEWAAAAKQDIYFLPPKLAKTLPGLAKEQSSEGYKQQVWQVRQELEAFEKDLASGKHAYEEHNG